MTERVSADWTRDQALEAQARYRREHGIYAPGGPMREWSAIQALRRDEVDYLAGHKLALINALQTCADSGLPIPDWAAKAILLGVEMVQRKHVDSWDEIFGYVNGRKPKVTSKRLKNERDRLRQKFDVQWLIGEAKEQGRSINESLFDEIASKIGISRTVCKELYTDGRQEYDDRLSMMVMRDRDYWAGKT